MVMNNNIKNMGCISFAVPFGVVSQSQATVLPALSYRAPLQKSKGAV